MILNLKLSTDSPSLLPDEWLDLTAPGTGGPNQAGREPAQGSLAGMLNGLAIGPGA